MTTALTDEALAELAAELFPAMTLDEALELADDHDDWLIPGLIASTSTLIFGEAKIGKSWLVSHLIGSLVTGGEFLGVPVPDRRFSVGVFHTDDAGHIEYSKRIRTVVDGSENVKLYPMGIMATDEHWQALLHCVRVADHNVVIIDNLTQILDGSINDDAVVRRAFDGIRKLTRAGISVVIVGHSSDKGAPGTGFKATTPLGSSYISTAVRWVVRVSKTRKRNLKVETYGNVGQDHQGIDEMVLTPETGARFSVSSVKSSAETVTEVRSRAGVTLDRNAEIAAFVVEQCQGLTKKDTAGKIAEKFGGSARTHQTSLSSKALSKMVRLDGSEWVRI